MSQPPSPNASGLWHEQLSTAWYLAKRRLRVHRVAIVLLVALGAFDLPKGVDIEEALLSWAVAGGLWLALVSFTHGLVAFHDEARFVPAGIGIVGLGSLLVALWVVFRPLAAPRALPDAQVRRAGLLHLVPAYGRPAMSL